MQHIDRDDDVKRPGFESLFFGAALDIAQLIVDKTEGLETFAGLSEKHRRQIREIIFRAVPGQTGQHERGGASGSRPQLQYACISPMGQVFNGFSNRVPDKGIENTGLGGLAVQLCRQVKRSRGEQQRKRVRLPAQGFGEAESAARRQLELWRRRSFRVRADLIQNGFRGPGVESLQHFPPSSAGCSTPCSAKISSNPVQQAFVFY